VFKTLVDFLYEKPNKRKMNQS